MNLHDCPLLESLLETDLVLEELNDDKDLILEAEDLVLNSYPALKEYIKENIDIFITGASNIEEIEENIIEFVSSFTHSILEHTTDMFICE